MPFSPLPLSQSQAFYHLEPENPDHAASIERLYDEMFGADRFQKASYLYRQGVSPIQELSWVAIEKGRLIGIIRYWPIAIGEDRHPALLLGPLAIAKDRAGQGIGRALVFHTLAIAAKMGEKIVLLVGDVEYYRRFGFVAASPLGFIMPGESRPERLQVAFLSADIVGKVTGIIQPAHASSISWPRAPAPSAPQRSSQSPS